MDGVSELSMQEEETPDLSKQVRRRRSINQRSNTPQKIKNI